jgi:hypothetical protein
LFCDTPGFADNRGAEIDYSNTLGIFESLENISELKTIIPIFFFLTDDLPGAGGGRGDNFRKVVK